MTPTREQVIRWARELGIIPPHPYLVPTDTQLDAVRKFAETQFSAGQQAERERYEPMQMFNIEKMEHETLYRIREELKAALDRAAKSKQIVTLMNKDFIQKKNNDNHN